jgi:membrane protease YdiL (CAAX protease family)
MSALAALFARVSGSTSRAVLVSANVLAALAFGAGHLPFAAQVFGALTAPVVVQIVTLNALLGIAFGQLYARWGLEHAMVAHFAADIVLHVIVGN